MVYPFKLEMILFSAFVLFIINSESIAPQKPYSSKELLAIDEFRPMVFKLLTMDFQKTDAYLLRWIRYSNFDLQLAAKHLEKSHKFRTSKNIDSILNTLGIETENPGLTPNPYKYLPYDINRHDRAGRPIVHIPFGRWNIRKYVIAGKLEIVNRQFDGMLEKITRKTFKEAATYGKDIDQFYVLGDLGGYTLRETGCLACLPVMASYARTSIAYAPFMKNVTTVNTPRIFNPALSLVKSITGDRVPFSFYDFDKAAWQKKLLKEIPLDQLPPTMQ